MSYYLHCCFKNAFTNREYTRDTFKICSKLIGNTPKRLYGHPPDLFFPHLFQTSLDKDISKINKSVKF